MNISQAGTYGWIRRRIATVAGVARKESGPRGFARAVAADGYIHALVRTGRITPEQLRWAVEQYHASPSDFAWLLDMDQATLGRADCVFLAEHGRFPTDARDFRLNGAYHQVCRSLLYDWHYYDDQLGKLCCNQAGRPYGRSPDVPIQRDIQTGKTPRGNRWAFGLVLATGLMGGPAIAAGILKGVTVDPVPAVWVFGVIWLLSFAALAAATVPRQVRYRRTILRCSRCDRELEPQQTMVGCPGCGALFETEVSTPRDDPSCRQPDTPTGRTEVAPTASGVWQTRP